MDMSTYRAHHEEILKSANVLETHLHIASLKQDATVALGLLARLGGKLTFHLKLEDGSLYPRIQASGNATAQRTAMEFQDEMGSLARVFTEYVAAWPHSKSIQESPEQFVEQTKGIHKALSERIKREESVLYPLAEGC